MLKQYHLRDYRFRLVLYVVLLSVLGIVVIGSAKASVQQNQIEGLIIGLIVMVVISLIDYNLILKLRRPVYLIIVVLLALVFSPLGHSSNGSLRWIRIPGIGFQFQPSEFTKILLIIFFAAYFMKVQEKLNTWRILLLTLVLAAVPLALIIKEPDLSTTVTTTMIFITLLFVAGLSYKIVLGVLSVGIPAGIIGIILILKEKVPFLQPYQYSRIIAWLEPDKYPSEAMQQQNSIKAIGSGMLWGKGLNNNSFASLKNGNWIPEPQTDFIFSIVGEELGFVGCITIVILILLIVFECILIAVNAKNLGGRLLCCGMAGLIGFQSFLNISVTTGLMPNTGLPLPFVSYGSTSLVSLYLGIGMVLNVGLQRQKNKSGELD